MNAQNPALVALLQPFVGQSGTLTGRGGETFSGTLVAVSAASKDEATGFIYGGEGFAKLVRDTDKHSIILTLDKVLNVSVLANFVEVQFDEKYGYSVLRFER